MRPELLTMVLALSACGGVDCDGAAFTTRDICVVNPTLTEAEITEIVGSVGEPLLPGRMAFGQLTDGAGITSYHESDLGDLFGDVYFQTTIQSDAPICLRPYVIVHELLGVRYYAKSGDADTQHQRRGWSNVDARQRQTEDWMIFVALCNRERCGDEWCDGLAAAP